jgi:hypothetical protein
MNMNMNTKRRFTLLCAGLLALGFLAGCDSPVSEDPAFISTVMLDKQGGTGGTDSVRVIKGEAMPTATAPTKPGSKFMGYFSVVKADYGALTPFYNSDMTSGREWNLSEDATLYARWMRNITWTAIPGGTGTPFNTSDIYGIAYGNGYFVAVGEGGKVARFANGQTWAAVVTSVFVPYHIYGIAYGNNTFVAVGDGKMALSALGGSAWTAVTDSHFTSADTINGIAYGGPAGSEKFVAVGTGGKMAYGDGL